MKKNIHEINRRDQDRSFDLILTMIFTRAFPVWKRYDGAVPPDVLEQLDEAGDWPRGLAAITMKRLSRDPELRKRMQGFLNARAS